jgi:heterokaryon incompatibility protein (HET)
MAPNSLSVYHHSALLQPDSIRLLRLLPSKVDSNNLQCELFEYTLSKSNNLTHPYEALSYVWGSEDTPRSIIIDNQNFKITQNLYMALSHLQDHSMCRVIWVDAVCINQTDEKEKEHQIQFMSEIYAQASRVIVWLGEAQDDSEQALEAIRLAGEKSRKLSYSDSFEPTVLRLLRRQWFYRIWVRAVAVKSV